uniref:UPF0538 protein n=1 Tax=Caligus rogercresseyi TaxID=217165 RepID=C1BN97_CALRO|nr:UPF0538 protein [Caligus rogercresseyi]ACO10887.1 UPF0538 protein [Caligus rogercresseyi]
MGVTLRIRIIRSFPHRNIRFITLHNVPLESTTVRDLLELTRAEISKSSLPPPFRTHPFDALKIEHNAFGAKTNDPVINREDDESLLMCEHELLLGDHPLIRNESEIALFKLSDYREYLLSPSLAW